MDFVNFKNHLQEILDSIATDTFVVSNTRDMVGRTNKTSVVFIPLAGSVYENSASIPYQLDIYAKDPDAITNIFTQIAKTKNGKNFISVIEDEGQTKEYTVYEYYTTPAISERQVDFGTQTLCHLVMFVTLNVLFEVGNVSSIKIDNENIEFTNGTLTYATEMFSNRKTGDNLNGARKKSATTNLQFTLVSKNSIFTNKLFYMAFNKLSGNTKFSVEIKLTNGIVGNLDMIINQNVFSFVKNSPNLPSFNVTLTTADTN